jgi:glycosyltransferase involved in cell wall biosynthesis
MEKNLVSIIMPCFNSEKFIEESIISVINQSYEDWELIICDDFSSDKTYELAEKYAYVHNRIILIKNTHDKGAPGARNSCLDKARGRYIAFLDSDDLWAANKLLVQINFMKSNNYSFTYSYINIINEMGNFVTTYKFPDYVGSKLMSFGSFIPCCSVIYDAHTLGKVYQPNIKKRNDYALWLKILAKEQLNYAYCLKSITASYRKNNYGLASNKLENIKYFLEVRKKYGESSVLKAYFELIIYLAFMVLKFKVTRIYNFLVTRL